jgi:hypothetical protein
MVVLWWAFGRFAKKPLGGDERSCQLGWLRAAAHALCCFIKFLAA